MVHTMVKKMALQLNEQTYKEFSKDATNHPRYIDQMPALIAEGRVPMSVSDLMQRRREVSEKDQRTGIYKFSDAVRSAWNDYDFDTGDAVAYHPDGNIKIVLDAQPLREINPKSKLNNGALALPDGMYETLKGAEFTREQIKNYVGKQLTSAGTKSNPFWQALVRDPDLLNSTVDSIFAQTKERFSYNENMGLYVMDKPKSPELRSWIVGRLEYGSFADGGDHLGIVIGRLVGVAPEARGAQKSASLEQRV